MKVIKPITITSDMIAATTAVEIYPEWAAGTAYAANEIVYFSSIRQHTLSQSFASGILSFTVEAGDAGFNTFIQTRPGGAGTRMLGDIGNDGAITLADAIAALKNVTGLNVSAELFYIGSVLIPAIKEKILTDPTYNQYIQLSPRNYIGKLYRRITAGTTSTVPELDVANWASIGPTNTFAMFDREITTITDATDSLEIVLDTGEVDSLLLYGLVGTSVEVTVRHGALPGTIVYGNTALTGPKTIAIDSSVRPATIVLTDIPKNGVTRLNVTIYGTGKVACALVDVGNACDLGASQFGASIEIVDFSRTQTDEFGVTTFLKRGNAVRLNARMLLSNTELTNVVSVLRDLKGVPCSWIATGVAGYESLNMFGWSEGVNVEVTYPTESYCSLTVQSLAQ